MFVYLFLFIFASVLFFSIKSSQKKPYYIFLWTLIFVAGFRDMIGGFDVYIYGEIFERISISTIYNGLFEVGFSLYFYLLSLINDQREFLFLVSSFIILFFHSHQIKKYTPLLYFSIFIYFAKFFLFSFVYIRQGTAMVVIWFMLKPLINKNYIQSIILLGIAFSIHKSSLVFAPLIFIAHKKFKPEQIYTLIAVIFIISITPVGNYLTSILADGLENEKLQGYVQKTGGINYLYLIESIIFISLILTYRKHFYLSKITTVIYNGFLTYTILIVFSLTNATFIRVTWYYFIFLILALPYMYIYNKKNKLFIKLLVYVYYSLVFFRLLFMFDDGDFMPYKSIFQDFDRHGMWEHMEYRNY